MITDELLIKYLSGRCSREENGEVRQWLDKDIDHGRLFELEQIWGLNSELRFSDSSRLDRSYRALRARMEKSAKPVRRRFTSILKYAAAVIIMVLAGANLYYMNRDVPSEDNVITVPKGQRVSLQLSDGTTVWLNAESRFSYPSRFSDRKREVKLEGEGYFEVAKNPDAPFTVSLPALDIRVLGTKFNVYAYKDEPSSVTLNEGSVEVSTHDGKACRRMRPNEKLTWSLSRGFVLERVKTPADDAIWVTGDLKFENRTLLDMAKVIGRRYGVTVKIADPSLAEEYFTCHFRSDLSLEQAMELLKSTRRVNWMMQDDTVYLYQNKLDINHINNNCL